MTSPRQEKLPNVLARQAVVLRSIALALGKPGLTAEQLRRMASGLQSLAEELLDVAAQVLTQMESRPAETGPDTMDAATAKLARLFDEAEADQAEQES